MVNPWGVALPNSLAPFGGAVLDLTLTDGTHIFIQSNLASQSPVVIDPAYNPSYHRGATGTTYSPVAPPYGDSQTYPVVNNAFTPQLSYKLGVTFTLTSTQIALLSGGIVDAAIRLTVYNGNSASPNLVYQMWFGAGHFPFATNFNQPNNYDFCGGTDLEILLVEPTAISGSVYVSSFGSMGSADTYQLDTTNSAVLSSFKGFPGIEALKNPASYGFTSGYNGLPAYWKTPFAVTGWMHLASSKDTLKQALTRSGSLDLVLHFKNSAVSETATYNQAYWQIVDVKWATVDPYSPSFDWKRAGYVYDHDSYTTEIRFHDDGSAYTVQVFVGWVVRLDVYGWVGGELNGYDVSENARVPKATIDFTQGSVNPLVVVMAPAAQVLSFTATPGNIIGSGQVTLTWTTKYSDSVSIDHSVGSQPANGSVTVPVNGPTTFTLTAVNTAGTATATAAVTWTRPDIVIRYFTATPSGSAPPLTALLQWGVDYADRIQITSTDQPAVNQFVTGQTSLTSPTISSPSPITYTLTAYQDDTGHTATMSVTVSVTPAPLSILNPTILASLVESTRNVSIQLNATGGYGVFTWSSSDLPAFLSLSPSGLLTGTLPLAVSTDYSFHATVTAVGASENLTAPFTIRYHCDPIALVGVPAQTGRAAELFTLTFNATGGFGVKVWSLTGNARCSDLTLSQTGVLSGVPTAPGYFNFTVTASDATGTSSIQVHLLVKRSWSELDPFHNVFYRILTPDGTPVLDGQGRMLTNDRYPDRGGVELFSRLVVASSVGTGDFAVQDARVLGGGVAETAPEEVQQHCWDLGFWDGRPYPIGGGMLLYLPETLLKTFTREQVFARVLQILPLGTYPILRFY